MKHKISILLLLSFAGSSECSQTYGAAASNKGHNQNRRSSSQEAVTTPSDYREIPAATGPVLKFGTDEPDTTLTWKKTKKHSGEKTYPSWDITSKGVADDAIARKVADSYTLHAKNTFAARVPEALKLRADISRTRQSIIHDTCHRKKPVIDQIPAMAGVITAAQQEKIRCSKLPDTISYKSSYIRTAVKQVEDTKTFPVQPKEKEGVGHRELNFENQILTTLSDKELPLLDSKQRHIGTLLIEEQRNIWNSALPSQLQLTLLSFSSYQTQIEKGLALFHGVDFSKKEHVAKLAYQVGIGDAAMLSDTEKMVGPAYRTLVTDLRRSQCLLLQMQRLQELRDAQLAFVKTGDAKALQLALLAPEKNRCTTMLKTIKDMIEAKKPNSCVDTGRYETSHSLCLLKASYKKRLDALTAQENALNGIQTEDGANAKLTTKEESSQPTSQADSTIAS